MSDIINQNTEPLFIFDMPDDETLSETISVKGEKGERGDPTKLSQLDNDTGFITKNVSNLTNYYDKTETDDKLGQKLDKTTFNSYEIPTDFFTGDETVSDTGSSITLSGTAEAVFKDITIYGNTAQSGTPTPQNPISIQTATGLQTITITSGLQTQAYTLDLGDIELCALDTYKDYIYKSGDNWYIHKEIGKIVLDGTERWAESGSYTGYFRGRSSFTTAIRDKGLCTHFPNRVTSQPHGGYNYIYMSGSYIYLQIAQSELDDSTISAFDDWLNANQPALYYVFSTATDTLITDNTLVAQLEALAKASSYNGTTIITASGSLPVLLSVEAFKNNWTGAISGLNEGETLLRQNVDKINGDIEDINAQLEQVEYIFPKNWGSTLSGDANLIKAYGKTILIDTHRASNKTQLEAMLTDHGVSHIDYLIITHYHDDHMGNVANLINDGFVTTATEVFTPADCDMIDESESLTELKAQVINALDGAGIDYHTPDEGETIELGDEWVLTFYNTDTDAINQMTNYNNGSILCKIEHGSTKILYTGDALGSALNRALANGFIDSKIDLYKVEHHGIQKDNTFFDVLRTIMPDYAVQPSGVGDFQRNIYSLSTTLGYLQSKGCKIFSVHKNTDYIIFRSTVNTMELVKGIQSPSVSNNNGYDGAVVKTLYVDANTTNTTQNGNSATPFKELLQALGECERMGSGIFQIRLAAGEYSAVVGNNDAYVNGLDVRIAANVGVDAEDVIIKGALNFRNSNVEITGVTLHPTEALTTISAAYSMLTLTNCIVTGEDVVNPTMIWSTHSNITLDTCAISNYYLGVSTHYDSVLAFNTSFENITLAAFYLRYTGLRVKNVTYTNVAAQITRSNGGYINGTPRVTLFEGDTKTGDISLNLPATTFNKLIIISGYVGGGTLLGDNVYPYNRNNFLGGATYNFRTLEDIAKITFSDDGYTATLTRGATTPALGIRGIYGVQDDVSDDVSAPE